MPVLSLVWWQHSPALWAPDARSPLRHGIAGLRDLEEAVTRTQEEGAGQGPREEGREERRATY